MAGWLSAKYTEHRVNIVNCVYEGWGVLLEEWRGWGWGLGGKCNNEMLLDSDRHHDLI